MQGFKWVRIGLANGHDTAGGDELDLYLDFEKMGLIDGAEFWVRAKGTWGGDKDAPHTLVPGLRVRMSL